MLSWDEGSPCPEATELGFSVATPRVILRKGEGVLSHAFT